MTESRVGASFSLNDLAVGYRGKPLIHSIQAEIKPGTLLTLIGPNGAGKSTILKTIARYLAAISGSIELDGQSISELNSRDLAKRVSVVLTDRLKTELMTCEDVVATGRYPHTGRFGILSRDDRLIVRESMELLDAWALRDQDFGEISDGQKQRVLIARALCQQPEIIVLDEPTAYLDVRYKLELLTVLRRLAKERGITVIMSLHELDMAQKVSDLVMCVKGDRIEHFGPPTEIFQGDQINEIFELEHGSFDPIFGSLEFAPVLGEPEIFVIAGGGTGIATYRELQRQGLPFATGVLHRNDVDFRIAERLAVEVVSEDGFEPISREAFDRASEVLSRCRAVVNCLEDYGTTNGLNRELAERAWLLGIPVVKAGETLLV